MLIFIICLWIALAIVVGITAAGRGRKGIGWTLLACLISPVVAGAFLLAITDRSPRASTPAPVTHIPCPACGKRIPVEARVCLHCAADVAEAQAQAQASTDAATPSAAIVPTITANAEIAINTATSLAPDSSAPDALPALREGYWFDTPDDADALIREGDHVRLPSAAPPWMVIDQSLSTLIIGSRWPGRLWRVRVTTLGDMSGLVAQPGYWRAEAIDLLEALPLSTLFGPHGDAVLRILDFIPHLTRADAQTLAQHLDPSAPAAYGRAWLAWSQTGEPPSPATAQQWDGTLAASRKGDKDRSPIHSGFMVIHAQLRQRAQAVDGADAIVLIEDEDDGETEEVLSLLWQQASDALLYAAMAQGAPQLVSEADAEALNRAWLAVQAERTA